MTSSSSTTPFQIPVRRDIAFDFSGTPAHHFVRNRLASQLWNALSLVAPQTEAFLIRAMKRANEKVSDPALRQQIHAFLAQEALHTRQHNALNARLAELGYDVERAGTVAENVLRELSDRTSLQRALALVIAGEYAIYAISRTVLEEPAVLMGTTSEVRRLMEWHALEEMEHQSVACDVYRHLFGEGLRHRLLHIGALVKACRVLIKAIRKIQGVLMEDEPDPTREELRAHAFYMLVSPGLIWRVLAKLPRFFTLGFRHWVDPLDRQLIVRGIERVYAEELKRPRSACSVGRLGHSADSVSRLRT